MKIPFGLKNILEKNQRLDGIITQTVAQYDQILRENNLYFFEEYTDHGIKHIESVLATSIKLIDENTIKKLLNDDANSIAVYILSVILHDIGMHIRPEGFYSLIKGDFDDIRIYELDKKTWRELWNEYVEEAKRFSDIDKKNIIGNLNWEFREPEIDKKDKLTGEDKKLIGEFIRRHHPRIAHEIALKGFPKERGYISFASELQYDLRNISGLLARSHGYNIRYLFNYLEYKYDETWTKPFNVEIIYLMVILRIADYFQFDSSRTEEFIVKLKTFNSPISQIEHYKHLDIQYVQPYKNDPETLIVQCTPRNSLIYIKLKELFSDIQRELDTSWAILGEIYGKEISDKQPKITFRRIKSNLDDVNKFSKKVDYIPEKIVFNVSNELPKLLIGPLYGNNPTYGIRELIQNAVDTCREREYLEETNYEGKVELKFYKTNDDIYFEIKDNGLGMNLDILKNYFLNVGSSLKKSSHWKKTFSDEQGKSKIQRSGRFGIGVLASFLIGDKIEVTTKDSNSSYGLSFTTDLNSEQIEIVKINKDDVGTSIKIKITKSTLEKLEDSYYRFDEWYYQSKPIVTYIDETNTFYNLGIKDKTPNYNEELGKEWRELIHPDFYKIVWTYDKGINNLISNGILIPNFEYFIKAEWDRNYNYWREDLEIPLISVFDFDGKLPLNLSRNDLDDKLNFETELKTEIYKDLIAKILTKNIEYPTQIKEYYINHPAISNRYSIKLIFNKNGFILKNKFFISMIKKEKLIKVYPISKEMNLSKLDIKDTFLEIIGHDQIAMSNYVDSANISSGGKLFISKEMYDKLFDNKYNRYPIGVRRDHKVLNSTEKFVELIYDFNDSKFSLNDFNENLEYCNCIIECNLETANKTFGLESEEILYDLFKEYFGDNCIIPYSLEERKRVFSKAFKELDYYIKKYIT